jgi:hypothetical protein
MSDTDGWFDATAWVDEVKAAFNILEQLFFCISMFRSRAQQILRFTYYIAKQYKKTFSQPVRNNFNFFHKHIVVKCFGQHDKWDPKLLVNIHVY